MDQTMRQEALKLIEMATLVLPEDEGIDLTDRWYTIDQLVELRATLAEMRHSIDALNRALAQAWARQYQGLAYRYGGNDWYLGYATKRVFHEGQDEAFAAWLKEQPVNKIRQIVSADSVRVTPIGKPGSPLRYTFFDEEPTSNELRIMHRPTR